MYRARADQVAVRLAYGLYGNRPLERVGRVPFGESRRERGGARGDTRGALTSADDLSLDPSKRSPPSPPSPSLVRGPQFRQAPKGSGGGRIPCHPWCPCSWCPCSKRREAGPAVQGGEGARGCSGCRASSPASHLEPTVTTRFIVPQLDRLDKSQQKSGAAPIMDARHLNRLVQCHPLRWNRRGQQCRQCQQQCQHVPRATGGGPYLLPT